MKSKEFDVVIIGAGISGTALAYVLSKYTNIEKVAVIEKYGKVAQVNSKSNNNSQTLHFGDIETNYTLEKATKVKMAADMVKNYVDKYDKEGKAHTKYHKMALAVGEEEIKELEIRIKEFKKLFPNIKRLERKEIEKVEPNVVKGRPDDQKLLALYSDDGYAMDFEALSNSFIENAKKYNPKIEIFFNTKTKEIIKSDGLFTIKIDDSELEFQSRVVVVTAGAHSLIFAKSLGYGLDFALLSLAGSFYLAPSSLNGKVYRMQIKKLPFAAIHGDPEVHDRTITRFGPTAKALFMLERHNYNTVYEYFKTAGFNFRALSALYTIFSDPVIFKYIFKNFLYDLPIIGKKLFIKEVRDIVPSVQLSDLKFAKGYGGLRPQVVNIPKKNMDLGEAKILGDNIIFNITPSPGASTCLRNAEDDTIKIMEFLGSSFKFNHEEFRKDLT